MHVMEKIHPASEQGIRAISGVNDEFFIDKVEEAGKALSVCSPG
jgi:hypothetical protein